MLRVLTKKDGYIIPNSIGTDRNKWFGAIPSFISKPADYLTVGCVTNHENLQRIADLSVEKELRVVIDSFFSFEETPTALNRMASRRAAGQVIHHQPRWWCYYWQQTRSLRRRSSGAYKRDEADMGILCDVMR
jgi:hypothetical protein